MKKVLFCLLCVSVFTSAMQQPPQKKGSPSSARTRPHPLQPRNNTPNVQTRPLNPNTKQQKNVPEGGIKVTRRR